MNAKHTPGPWRRALSGAANQPGTIIVAQGDSRYVASVNYRGSVDRTSADADLIAAAPELLETCKRLMEQISETGTVNQLEGQRAIAVIAKAEGSWDR